MANLTAKPERQSFQITRWLFLRGLSSIYLIAFLSLAIQISGLLGPHGILPASDYLAAVAGKISGPMRYLSVPTVAWFDSSDIFLQSCCWLGATCSLIAVFDVATAPCLAVCFLLYLSLVSVGQVFLSFQWDALLLESGFLSLFWAPWHQWSQFWTAGRQWARPASTVVLWLYRCLLFKLMFLSGCSKIVSGDLTWRSLEALRYYYFTQPLPTPLAWYAHQLPTALQVCSAATVFFVELIVPFLIFCPRHFRQAAAVFIVLLQVAILLTGNYTFFNLLTICLCITLFDDERLAKLLPSRMRDHLLRYTTISAGGGTKVVNVLAMAIALISLIQFGVIFQGESSLSQQSRMLLDTVAPFHVVNTYGLFAVMTTVRHEIMVEGSNDSQVWKSYRFKYKPGPLDRPPPVVAPYQPRLDWQMWFAAIGSLDENRWFVRFARRLLQGSPQVIALLDGNPFPKAPPRYIRARLETYTFTDFAQRNKTGHWWNRIDDGAYLPAIKLKEFKPDQR